MNSKGQGIPQLLDHARIGRHRHISHFGKTAVGEKSYHGREDKKKSKLEKNLSWIPQKYLNAAPEPSADLREKARELQRFFLTLGKRNRLELFQNILLGKSFRLRNGAPISGPLFGLLFGEGRVDQFGALDLKVVC